MKVETDDTEYHYFFAGINPDNSAYHLKKGETFTTPKVAFSFSKCGLSGVSRNFHKWGRKYMLAHGNKERKILLNSWEGVYFDINQQGMDQMMGDIASMGGEQISSQDRQLCPWRLGGGYQQATRGYRGTTARCQEARHQVWHMD